MLTPWDFENIPPTFSPIPPGKPTRASLPVVEGYGFVERKRWWNFLFTLGFRHICCQKVGFRYGLSDAFDLAELTPYHLFEWSVRVILDWFCWLLVLCAGVGRLQLAWFFMFLLLLLAGKSSIYIFSVWFTRGILYFFILKEPGGGGAESAPRHFFVISPLVEIFSHWNFLTFFLRALRSF